MFKKEKEGNIQDCIGKIKVAFHSMKLKADKKLSAITTKLEELLELKRKMMATERKEKDTQTITNFDVEIDSLRKTIQDLERNYHYLAETRREENQKTNK